MTAETQLVACLSEQRRAANDHHTAMRQLTQLELRADQQHIRLIEAMLQNARETVIAQAQLDLSITAEQVETARIKTQDALTAREQAQHATMTALQAWATENA